MKTISYMRSTFVRNLQRRLRPSKIIQIVPEREIRWVPEDVKQGYLSAVAAENDGDEDVKQGYFAVVAAENDGEKPMRFVVELSVLKHPSFLNLPKMAEDEYGFQQKGILVIPCRPNEVQGILEKIGNESFEFPLSVPKLQKEPMKFNYISVS